MVIETYFVVFKAVELVVKKKIQRSEKFCFEVIPVWVFQSLTEKPPTIKHTRNVENSKYQNKIKKLFLLYQEKKSPIGECDANTLNNKHCPQTRVSEPEPELVEGRSRSQN